MVISQYILTPDEWKEDMQCIGAGLRIQEIQ
jgi:hypothetical protein